MNPIISSQQTHFYNQNGYIEFESILSNEECDWLQAQIRGALLHRIKREPARIPAQELYANGRDLWRGVEPLKNLLLSRRMTSIAFGLTNKNSLRLGCDQWIPSSLEWAAPAKSKDLFSLQGIACAFLIRMGAPLDEETLKSTFRLEPGLIPLPAKRGDGLIVNPNLLLNFPKLSLFTPTDLYLVAYCLPKSVYIHNKEDPSNSQLKSMGYNFGDCLNNQYHPLIMAN